MAKTAKGRPEYSGGRVAAEKPPCSPPSLRRGHPPRSSAQDGEVFKELVCRDGLREIKDQRVAHKLIETVSLYAVPLEGNGHQLIFQPGPVKPLRHRVPRQIDNCGLAADPLLHIQPVPETGCPKESPCQKQGDPSHIDDQEGVHDDPGEW